MSHTSIGYGMKAVQFLFSEDGLFFFFFFWIISIPIAIAYESSLRSSSSHVKGADERDVFYLDQLLPWPDSLLRHFQGSHNAPGPIGGEGGFLAFSSPEPPIE